MKKNGLTGAAALVLTLMLAVSMTSEATELKAIMQGLRDNLVEIADGLLTDDFEQIVRGATAVAEHPQIPPEQVQLVAAELGPEMPAFKQLDILVHDLSLEISASASANDREATVAAFEQMLEGCLACHNTYKERVTAALSQPDDGS